MHKSPSEPRWLKAELHSHCSLDPVDYKLCHYSPEDLIAKAAGLGYEVLAITCHDLDIWTSELSEYAESLGVTLIPGMEVTTEGLKHTLVYNFRTDPENLDTLGKIRTLSREDTLVIAPHPYFPTANCLKGLLDQNINLFDAIEVSGFFAPGLDFNRRSKMIAEVRNKPLVGNGDVHYLWQLGRTFTWIYAAPKLYSVIDAIKHGRVRVESSALSYREIAEWWATALWRKIFPAHPAPTRGKRQGLGLDSVNEIS